MHLALTHPYQVLCTPLAPDLLYLILDTFVTLLLLRRGYPTLMPALPAGARGILLVEDVGEVLRVFMYKCKGEGKRDQIWAGYYVYI